MTGGNRRRRIHLLLRFSDNRGMRLTVLAVAGLAFLAGTVGAQSMRVEDLAQGRILIPPRQSPDPVFAALI